LLYIFYLNINKDERKKCNQPEFTLDIKKFYSSLQLILKPKKIIEKYTRQIKPQPCNKIATPDNAISIICPKIITETYLRFQSLA